MLFMQDGNKMDMQEIVNAFLPGQARSVGNIPKLFFIDACRGNETFQPVVVPRTGGKNVQTDCPQRTGTRDRGGTEVKTVLVPPNGNTIIAYSNISKNRVLESKDGGVWMKALARKLAESRESIDTVLTQVREDLQHIYQDPNWRDKMQLPETISCLLRPVYLHPDAQHKAAAVSQPANVSPPGVLTQRDETHPGHYKGKFLHLQQKNIIRNVEERYEKSFVCVLTFVKCSNGRSHQFQSEKEFKTKQEAKESAAKRAVLFLNLEARDATNNQPQQVPLGQQKRTTSVPLAAVSASPAKDPKSKLKEYCDKNGIRQKYDPLQCGDARYQVKVMVCGKIFAGELKTTKKEAEKSAAQKALTQLNLE